MAWPNILRKKWWIKAVDIQSKYVVKNDKWIHLFPPTQRGEK